MFTIALDMTDSVLIRSAMQSIAILTAAQSRSVDATPKVMSLVKPLGSGSNGSVYLGRLSSGERVAVKQIPLQSYEHIVLERLAHPNVICIRGSIAHPTCRLLLLEYIDNGMELFTLINLEKLSISLIKIIFGQLLSALTYLHEQQSLVHGDLKPENILVAMHHGRPMVKLIDFGMCRATDRTYTGLWGSLEYAPPEMNQPQPLQYDPIKAEMWSLGVVLFTMVHRTLPSDHPGPVGDCIFTEIINALMHKDPRQRPTCRDIYDHFRHTLSL